MKRRDFVTLGIVAFAVAACGKQQKLIAGLTSWHVTNAGIPGDTAEAGKSRIRGLLDEHTPALVIIEIGGNDFLRRRSPSAVKEDIKFLIAAAKNAGAQVVLIGVPELSLLAVVVSTLV